VTETSVFSVAELADISPSSIASGTDTSTAVVVACSTMDVADSTTEVDVSTAIVVEGATVVVVVVVVVVTTAAGNASEKLANGILSHGDLSVHPVRGSLEFHERLKDISGSRQLMMSVARWESLEPWAEPSTAPRLSSRCFVVSKNRTVETDPTADGIQTLVFWG
jgi:hypothetical protein